MAAFVLSYTLINPNSLYDSAKKRLQGESTPSGDGIAHADSKNTIENGVTEHSMAFHADAEHYKSLPDVADDEIIRVAEEASGSHFTQDSVRVVRSGIDLKTDGNEWYVITGDSVSRVMNKLGIALTLIKSSKTTTEEEQIASL